MNPLQVFRKLPIPNQCGSSYRGIAFDGCSFYLTCPEQCMVKKYDACFCEAECLKVARPYTCLCYDHKEHCFWAACAQCYYKLFKLDRCFNEIDSLTVCAHASCGAVIEGVSYDCQRNRLLVTFENGAVSVCANDHDEEQLKTCFGTCNMGICCVAPSYVAIEMLNSKQHIVVYDCNFEPQCTLDIPSDYFAESVILNPCGSHGQGQCHFYLLTTKNDSYPYLLEWKWNGRDVEIGRCNFFCEVPCPKPPCPGPNPPCPCPPGPKPPCPDPTYSCNDLLESVALIEAALAEILHMEGKKLQKIIAGTNDVGQILCANEVIGETIVRITHLEIILHDKLTVIQKCCCNRGCGNEHDCHDSCGCEAEHDCGDGCGCEAEHDCGDGCGCEVEHDCCDGCGCEGDHGC